MKKNKNSNIYGDEEKVSHSQKVRERIKEELLDYQIDSENGIVFLNGEIEDCETSFFIRDVLYIRRMNPELESLNLIIDSPGGSLHTMFGIIDYIHSLDIPVNTICRGQSMSAAAMIFSCTSGKRYISKNSILMFHEMSLFSYGKINEAKTSMKFYETLEDRALDLIVKYSNKDVDFWRKTQEKDFYVTAEKALELGLADEII